MSSNYYGTKWLRDIGIRPDMPALHELVSNRTGVMAYCTSELCVRASKRKATLHRGAPKPDENGDICSDCGNYLVYRKIKPHTQELKSDGP